MKRVLPDQLWRNGYADDLRCYPEFDKSPDMGSTPSDLPGNTAGARKFGLDPTLRTRTNGLDERVTLYRYSGVQATHSLVK